MKPVYKAQQVQSMRREYWVDLDSMKTISERYSINRRTLYDIVHYVTWLSIPDIYTGDETRRVSE